MRNRFDYLAKQIGQEALGPSGPTVAHDEISPETQHADLRHEPELNANVTQMPALDFVRLACLATGVQLEADRDDGRVTLRFSN